MSYVGSYCNRGSQNVGDTVRRGYRKKSEVLVWWSGGIGWVRWHFKYLLIRHSIPGFGVCLGLQGMVKHFGGELGVLGYPMHGKPSTIKLTDAGKAEDSIFAGIPDTLEVARYHSLHGIKESYAKLPGDYSSHNGRGGR